MNIQMKILRRILEQGLEDIDNHNCNITDEDCEEFVQAIKKYVRKDEPMSKYQAYTYLNISRANFDLQVKAGKLPEGKSISGFKEKIWYKKDLDEAIKQSRKGK